MKALRATCTSLKYGLGWTCTWNMSNYFWNLIPELIRVQADREFIMEEMLGFQMKDNDDFYKLLGCDELSTVSFVYMLFDIRF